MNVPLQRSEEKIMDKKNIRKIITFSIFGAFILIMTILTINALSNSADCEKRIEYYYNPSCPHCQEVSPLIYESEKIFTNWKFYYYDASQTSYKDVLGVPTIKIYPGDGREVILSGSYEIPKYLKCELQEMSTLECPTHHELIRESYFIEG